MLLTIKPVSLQESNEFIEQYHNTHKRIYGFKFGVGIVNEDNKLIGVATAGRPVSRHLDDGYTIEITRVCTNHSEKNMSSRLIGALSRASKALGYKKIISYTLVEEEGISFKASNFSPVHTTKAETWNRDKRKRIDKAPIGKKIRWEKEL